MRAEATRAIRLMRRESEVSFLDDGTEEVDEEIRKREFEQRLVWIGVIGPIRMLYVVCKRSGDAAHINNVTKVKPDRAKDFAKEEDRQQHCSDDQHDSRGG